MSTFKQNQFDQFVIDKRVIGFFDEPITLKSGRESSWYVNWRPITSNVRLINDVADHVISFTQDLGLDPDCFYGVPEGATKLGIITQFKWAQTHSDPAKHGLPMGRSKPKEHGAPADRFFVGAPTGKVIVLEDVTTTGISLITCIKDLQAAGITIIAAIGLTDRMETLDNGSSVSDAIQALGVPYHSLSQANTLLPQAITTLKPSESTIQSIKDQLTRYNSTIKL